MNEIKVDNENGKPSVEIDGNKFVLGEINK